MFAVLYRGYLKQGCEAEYKNAWKTIASYFISECGAIGSCLHRTEDGLWVAYSRWPSKAMRDAVWPLATEATPDNVLQAMDTLKKCIEYPLPEVCMEVVEELASS